MKTKLQIKKRFLGNVIFELETEDNTVKDTLIEAVKSGANLRGANLRGADLSGANLRGADLRGANLRGANLNGADLRGANLLRGADLSDAYLNGADLSGADLSGADLRGADLNGADLNGADLRGADLRDAIGVRDYIFIPGRYYYSSYCFFQEKTNEWIIRLGCHCRTLAEWEKDFWNNDKEFPNNGSVKSQKRLYLFELYKQIITTIKSQDEKIAKIN